MGQLKKFLSLSFLAFALSFELGGATSFAADGVENPAPDCKELLTPNAAPAPAPAVLFDGLSDVEFFGRVTYLLDEFWQRQFDTGLKIGDFGLKGPTRRLFTDSKMKGFIRRESLAPFKIVIYSDFAYIANKLTPEGAPLYDPLAGTLFISNKSIQSNFYRYFPSHASWVFAIAHEMAHHVQSAVGIIYFRSLLGAENANAFERRMELQADCLAGVWLHHHLDIITPEELQEIVDTSMVLGGPNHGTGEQRKSWLLKGLDTGRIDSCHTFELPEVAL